VPTFLAAYLIHGDDHGRLGERRARLRAMAEAAAGSAGVEVYEGDACTPEAIAAALASMTFALGRRFVIADGVERWKDADVAPVTGALKGIDPETLTVAFFAREDAKLKAPAELHAAVKAVGGKIDSETAVKPWHLPGWVRDRAAELGLTLDREGSHALVAQVGDRQQRLMRELEKLALEHPPGSAIGVQEVEDSCASSAEEKVWNLADALVAGDRRAATRLLLELRQQGERIPGLTFGMVRGVRDALNVAEALAAGQSAAQARKLLRKSPKKADQFVAMVAKRDVDAFRRALAALADLEVESRGGVGLGAALSEDTAALRAVLVAAG
jgi:DNA polymerase III subunit delta